MRAADQVHVVLLQEARDDVGPEREGDAAVVLAPARNVFVGVRPEEIAEETAVWDLLMCQSIEHRHVPSLQHSRLSAASHDESAP